MIHPKLLSTWRTFFSLLLGLLGTLQILGHLVGSKTIKAVGTAMAASPFPKVFSDVNGLETFASTFILEIETRSGQKFETQITPELYQHLKGPYNRRNVYGAALSYAPRLPQTLWESIFCYGFYQEAPLRKELGLPQDIANIKVIIKTNTRGRDDTWLLNPTCKE